MKYMLTKLSKIPIAMIGFVLILVALAIDLVISTLIFFLRIFENPSIESSDIGIATSLLTLTGLLLFTLDILKLAPLRRKNRKVENRIIENNELTVVLTAYNDQESISDSVLDFLAHPFVKRVLVIDNNSVDNTNLNAKKAGAIVHLETKQGYGACVYRAMIEASKFEDTDFFVLCEGDLTFKALDIDKLFAYAPHGDVINGTRIVEQLRDQDTQLTTFMFFGNFAVGKLLELKHLGKGTITDVGTTYKICRSETIRSNISLFNSSINHEFNAHFLDVCLRNDLRIVEVPITFHKRVGVSKGGNSSNLRAVVVGLRMIFGIIFGWNNLEGKYAK
jgi:glycosyltransferase involved in cell wall biosynthesis